MHPAMGGILEAMPLLLQGSHSNKKIERKEAQVYVYVLYMVPTPGVMYIFFHYTK